MAKTLFNQNNVDFTKQPMFFGEDQNTQRFDVYKYPIFDKLTQQQLSYFWRPEEINLQKDRADFQKLQPEQKFIFTSNLKYQTLLDSVQGRGPAIAYLPNCSLPELECCIITWDFFEAIHSRSYTHIIKNVYPDPSEVFDTILNDEAIIKRATSVTRYYDSFINFSEIYNMWDMIDHNKNPFYNEVINVANNKFSGDIERAKSYILKKKLYLSLLTVNILEGIRFYVSFACTFAFGELRFMEGSAKILSFIARDESQHLAITQHIIKNLKNDDKEFIDIMSECEPEIYELYKEAVQEEKEWAAHLFKNGSMIGLNETLLSQYIEHMANKRMKAINLNPCFDQPISNNPLPWMDNWLNSRGVQVAPQEAELSQYLVGGIKQDIKENDFSDFKL